MARHLQARHNAVLTRDEYERKVAGTIPKGKRVTQPIEPISTHTPDPRLRALPGTRSESGSL